MSNANEKITFYYNPMSRGQIVHWMLEEVGAPYEIKILNWKTGDHKKPEYLAINPMGKIPSIVHRGTVVTEGAAICAYLADAFPNAHLAPPVDSPERGAYYRWFFFATNCIEPAVLEHKFPRKEAIPTTHAGFGAYEDVVKTAEKAVGKDGFLLGKKFTAADLYFSSQLGWNLMQKTIEPLPAFIDYVARCNNRPAHQRFEEQVKKMM